MKKKTGITIPQETEKTAKLKCWEYFHCNEFNCPALKSQETISCWLISGTYCRKEIRNAFPEKTEICLKCKVFKANMDRPSMEETMTFLSHQFKTYRQALEARDRELEGTSMDLSIGLSETFEALRKISSGDPSVRIKEESNIELLMQLKRLVNLTNRAAVARVCN
jgi:hypothetical protein